MLLDLFVCLLVIYLDVGGGDSSGGGGGEILHGRAHCGFLLLQVQDQHALQQENTPLLMHVASCSFYSPCIML